MTKLGFTFLISGLVGLAVVFPPIILAYLIIVGYGLLQIYS